MYIFFCKQDRAIKTFRYNGEFVITVFAMSGVYCTFITVWCVVFSGICIILASAFSSHSQLVNTVHLLQFYNEGKVKRHVKLLGHAIGIPLRERESENIYPSI